MTYIKCPFCGKPIRYLGTDLFTCDACHIMLPTKHWNAYINTLKTLNNAVDALKEIIYFFDVVCQKDEMYFFDLIENNINKYREICYDGDEVGDIKL